MDGQTDGPQRPPEPRDWQEIRSTALEVIGMGVLSVGFGMLWVWLGVVVLGICLVVLGFAEGLDAPLTIPRRNRPQK